MSNNPISMALGRLEEAVARLEGALARRSVTEPAAAPSPSGAVDGVSEAELARLRAENAELAVAADTVSSRLDKTIERLKTVLDA